MFLEDIRRPVTLTHRRVPLDCPPAVLLEALVAQEDPVLLESTALHETYGRYSVITCCPLDVLTLRDGVLTDRRGDALARGDQALWKALHRALGFSSGQVRNSVSDISSPYVPGWFGYLGYELGRHVERLPARAPRDPDLPDLRLGFYDAVLVYDAVDRTWSLIEASFDPPLPGTGRATAALRRLAASPAAAPDEAHPAPVESADARVRPIDLPPANFTPEDYRRAVARCVEYIAAGDIFQVNLSQRFTVPDAPSPPAIYRSLRRRSPAWYAGYLQFASAGSPVAVLSSSPELFLRLRGDRVTTRPIKGTRPRVGIDAEDRAAAAALLASEKDNAELAMIVDLLRNDLGRVCRFGTVRVSEPRRLETHPTVFHLVATVVGRLSAGVGPAELIRATFPGGSITGAPKIRAMEIIDELEPVARGVYTGSIGTVGVNGFAEWNIAIRTMVCEGGRAHVQAGGGIVADSTPDLEYAETLDKARAMLESIAIARLSEQPPAKQERADTS